MSVVIALSIIWVGLILALVVIGLCIFHVWASFYLRRPWEAWYGIAWGLLMCGYTYFFWSML